MSFENMDHEILVFFGAEFLPCLERLKSNVSQLEKSMSFSGQYDSFAKDLYPHYGNLKTLGFEETAAFIKIFQLTGEKCSEFNDWQARTECLDIMKGSCEQLEALSRLILGNSIPDLEDEAQLQKAIALAKQAPLLKFQEIDASFRDFAQRSQALNSTTIAKLVAAKEKSNKKARLV